MGIGLKASDGKSQMAFLYATGWDVMSDCQRALSFSQGHAEERREERDEAYYKGGICPSYVYALVGVLLPLKDRHRGVLWQVSAIVQCLPVPLPSSAVNHRTEAPKVTWKEFFPIFKCTIL